MSEQISCKRCGNCCYYLIPKEEENYRLKKCKHLVRLNNGKTLCREYNKRKQLRSSNGLVIDKFRDNEGNLKQIWCVWRENTNFNYEDCPYNVDGKIYFKDYCEKHGVIIK